MNRGQITIDDDGNINMVSSPTHSPSPIRVGTEIEEPIADVKTFVA